MQLNKEIKKLFKTNDLFAGLSEQQQEDFAGILSEVSFAKDEHIVTEGEKSDKIYIILQGSAVVIKQVKGGGDEDEQTVASLKAGDTIGEVTLIDKQPRSASVRALESTKTIVFHTQDLQSISKEETPIDSKIKLNFALRLSQYLRSTNVKTVTERKKHKAEITKITNFDVVTGLPNEHLLQQRIYDQVKSKVSELSLDAIEITDFKEICDSLGSKAGDELLTQITERLGEYFPESEMVARIAKNQFAILNVGDHIEQIAQRCVRSFVTPFLLDDNELVCNVNIGVARYPEDAKNEIELLKHAGLAVDAAKLSNTNSFSIYDKSMNEAVANRRQLVQDMHEALKNDQFMLFYQPQITLKDNKMVGAEALIRWEHPTRGMVSPVDFIPAAESSGMIVKLGQWILKTACKQAKAWQANEKCPVRVAINLSPKQFQDKNMVADIKQLLEQNKIDPKLIELEITESLMMDDIEGTIAKIQELADLGVIIAIDDFGTGYSSLSYLSRLPAHKLKIDQSFVKEIEKGKESKDIIRCVVSLAESLNMETIAEGIEEEVHIDFLKSLGCHEGQGYYYNKPMPADDFEREYLTSEDEQHENN